MILFVLSSNKNIKSLIPKLKSVIKGLNPNYLFVGFLIILILIGYLLCVEPFYDAGRVYYAAVDVVEKGTISKIIVRDNKLIYPKGYSNNDYFLIYPNNFFMVMYLVPLFKFGNNLLRINFHSADGWYYAIVINCISIWISVLFGYCTIRKIKGQYLANCFLISEVLFLPNYLCSFHVYSDTLSMPWVTLAIFLSFSVTKSETLWKKVLILMVNGVVLGIGFLIKGSVGILLIAIIIFIFICFEKDLFRSIVAVFLLLFGFMTVIHFENTFYKTSGWIDCTEQDRYKLPLIHWVMMSSEGGGGYDPSDFNYSLSFETLEERKKADWEEYVRRVNAYGNPLNFVRAVISKLSNGMTDGRFYQQNSMEISYDKNKGIGTVVCSEGKFNRCLITYLHLYIAYLYFSILLGALIRLKEGIFEKSVFFLQLTHFGIILFFALWEFKSRYLLNYSSVLVMLCTLETVGITKIVHCFELIYLKLDKIKFG